VLDSSRINYFISLCGLHSIKHNIRGIGNFEEHIKRNKVKYACQGTVKAQIFILKIAFKIKALPESKSEYLFPNHETNNNYLISSERAITIFREAMEQEGFDRIDIEDMSESLIISIGKDSTTRLLHRKIISQEESSGKQCISFDAFMEFLLDCYSSLLTERVRSVIKNIKSYCKDFYETRISLEDFILAVTHSITSSSEAVHFMHR